MHYLRHNWRNASDIPDLRQEVYARVFEAARENIPENAKRFLLASARNLLIDLVRREQVVPMDSFADFESLEIATDSPQPDRAVIEREELRRLKTALEQLPNRIREAVTLACFEGLSRPEIAKRMGISPSRVSHHLADGAFILGDLLHGAVIDRGSKS
jgi:RNA polymerase sigma-70 factor (ECF subfamily)